MKGKFIMNHIGHVLGFFLMCILLYASCPQTAYSQDRKLVTGRILNKKTGKPFGKNDIVITIYAFDTEAEAEDALKVLNEGTGVVNGAIEFMPPDISGYYQGAVAETGALIFKPDLTPGILERVRSRSEINVLIDAGELLTASQKIESAPGIIALDEESEISGNYLNALYTFRIPPYVGRRNARLILQPFFIDGVSKDTISTLEPWVYDGTQFSLTQKRRMGYDTGNDPLSGFVRKDTLTKKEFFIPWRDTVYLENPSGRYMIRGKIQVEDFNGVYFSRDSLPLASVRARRPMQFLEYNFSPRELDPSEYYIRPRPEKVNTAGEISLSFLINRAEIDFRDTMNTHQLGILKSRLSDIVTAETSKLKEFHITGVASPDGMYEKNLALAKKRTEFAQKQITSVLPEYVRKRVYMTVNAEVAPWTDVADLLEKDSLLTLAGKIREIVRSYPGRHYRQSLEARQLPEYRKVITGYLARLRTVRYTYVHEEFRELTPEEVMVRYRTDKDYIDGKKHFDLYEYWHLFRMISDPDEKEEVSRRAYEETIEDNGSPWILAANNLAGACIRKGIADTTILAPFIDTRFKCNRRIRHADGTYETLNPEAVVANQLCMYLMTEQFSRASILSQMLPDTEANREIIALTMCLGGYYKGGNTPEEHQKRNSWFETAAGTSPLNRVVMYLAPNTRSYDVMAGEALESLPDENPLKWYFKAVLSSRRCGYPDADVMEPYRFEEYLARCFELDPDYIDIALTDGDINEDMLKDFLKYNDLR